MLTARLSFIGAVCVSGASAETRSAPSRVAVGSSGSTTFEAPEEAGSHSELRTATDVGNTHAPLTGRFALADFNPHSLFEERSRAHKHLDASDHVAHKETQGIIKGNANAHVPVRAEAQVPPMSVLEMRGKKTPLQDAIDVVATRKTRELYTKQKDRSEIKWDDKTSSNTADSSGGQFYYVSWNEISNSYVSLGLVVLCGFVAGFFLFWLIATAHDLGTKFLVMQPITLKETMTRYREKVKGVMDNDPIDPERRQILADLKLRTDRGNYTTLEDLKPHVDELRQDYIPDYMRSGKI